MTQDWRDYPDPLVEDVLLWIFVILFLGVNTNPIGCQILPYLSKGQRLNTGQTCRVNCFTMQTKGSCFSGCATTGAMSSVTWWYFFHLDICSQPEVYKFAKNLFLLLKVGTGLTVWKVSHSVHKTAAAIWSGPPLAWRQPLGSFALCAAAQMNQNSRQQRRPQIYAPKI